MQAIDATDTPASVNVIAPRSSPVAGILEIRGFLGCSFAGGFVGSFTLVIVKPSEALPAMRALYPFGASTSATVYSTAEPSFMTGSPVHVYAQFESLFKTTGSPYASPFA